MPAGQPLLRAANLQLVTGARISLRLAAGSIHCISGASGSGKTRLLRALADLDDTGGELWLDGQPRDRFTAGQWRQQVMLSPAQPRWWLDTVQAHCSGEVGELAERLHLRQERLLAPVEELSTGEQVRGGLLRALSHEPRVLLLDEPTGPLDPSSSRATEILLQEWLNPSRAIIWISHDAAQIKRVASQHFTLTHQGLSPA